jgi:hypothetical protein
VRSGDCKNIMGDKDGMEGKDAPKLAGKLPNILSKAMPPMQNLVGAEKGPAKSAECSKVWRD